MSESSTEREWRALFSKPAHHPARLHAREALVTEHLPLVHTLARRYIGRGEPFADLVQVGSLGLIKAVDRFDPNRGTPFRHFATPTINGEIRRHFRDHSWLLRVPRDLQELSALVHASTDEILQRTGRTPAPQEVADLLGIGVDQVVVAMDISVSRYGVPLDGVDHAHRSSDSWFEEVENRVFVGELLTHLPERERMVLVLRYFGGWSQQRIAAVLNCSQMQVSRLQDRALDELRISLECASDRGRECQDDADHSEDD